MLHCRNIKYHRYGHNAALRQWKIDGCGSNAALLQFDLIGFATLSSTLRSRATTDSGTSGVHHGLEHRLQRQVLVGYLQHGVMLTETTGDAESVVWDGGEFGH